MKKHSSLDNRKSVLAGVVALVVVTIAGLGVVAAVATQQSSNLSPGRRASVVNLRGEAECLPKKNPGDIQTTECASGLLVGDGTFYALSGPEAALGSFAGSGKTIAVTGTLTPALEDEIYDIAGTIEVSAVSSEN